MESLQLDMPRLASFFTIPETSLNSLLSCPTIEIIQTLLGRASIKAREHEQLEAENTRLEVQLENVVRADEAKIRVLKASLEKGQKEVEQSRHKLQAEETSKQAIESELQSVKASNSSTSAEILTLKIRIASLESSNRDTLCLLESKTSAYEELAGELSTKHQRTIELRREVGNLEQTISSNNASLSTARFREQGLQQEIDSLKRSNEWLDQELTTKSAEHSKFRKDKNAHVAELQQQNEEATSTIETLQHAEKTLRSRLEEVNKKADEFIQRASNLQDEMTQQQETFQYELDTANRLAELRKTAMETERDRHRDLLAQLEKAKEDAAEEIGRINAEVETEHQERLAAEQRVTELELHIERLEADAATYEVQEPFSGSPNRSVHDRRLGPASQMDSLSRNTSPALSRTKGGLSFTRLFSDYHNAKAGLEVERKRNEKLSATIDEMIQDMERHQPEVAELQADHDRLEADVLELSTLIDNVSQERDQAKKDARKSEGQITGMEREADLLRQQLRDLSSQVKVLLMEVNAQNQGLESYTPHERMQLEQLARGEIETPSSQDVSDTDRFISENLTTFKNLSDLQEQNTKLLRIARELGDRLEGEEAQNEKTQASQNEEEIANLRSKYERCRDEMQSLAVQSQSYIRERDMFRRMLSHRGQLPPGSDLASMFGESVADGDPRTPNRNHVANGSEQSPSSKDLADYTKLVKEMQSHFDSYRHEAAIDRSTLKQQLDDMSKKNTELRAAVSQRTSETILANERYEMLQGNYTMLKTENSELQKRSQVLSDRTAKQDLRTQQVAEDLVQAKGQLESMRNEIANLKAEKEFWKTVENRLTEDNTSTRAERDRLNIANANLQNLLNEREHSDAESRRKQQSQNEALESELQLLRRKLSDEIEEGKRSNLRHEYDHQQKQSRIDDLATTLGAVREELISAKTTRDYLQHRVDEMAIELRSAEERLQLLRPRALLRSMNETNANQDASEQLETANREQELAVEVSELKRDLDLAKTELANAKIQVDQYKAISLSSEEELQSLNDTQDQYRAEMDQIIAEKDTRIRELEQVVAELRSEIITGNSELSSLRAEIANHGQKFEEHRASLLEEITRLKDLNERSETAAQFHQQDLRAQAEIAQEAQKSYENELVKHAEAAQNLQKVRGDYNQLKLEVAGLKAENESAQTRLVQSEESWAEARERYERELTQLKSRRDDISTQNRLLHQQLETVSDQISDLQQKRVSDHTDEEDTGARTLGAGSLELMKYLRREKEIVDVQWELSSQEAKRLRQQLDHTQSQLDDARLKLNQQRRAEENSERNALEHNKLMETINELNLNRESNVTLRLEKSQAQASLAEQLKLVEELRAQLQPLRSRVLELEEAQEVQAEDLRMTREARERFEQRYHDLLNKSDSIDPAEFEALKDKVVALEAERAELVSSRQELQNQVDSIPDQIKQTQDQANERHQENRQRLIDQSKSKAREQNAKIREKDVALQAAVQEKDELEKQLQASRQEVEAANRAKDEAIVAQQVAQVETHGKDVQSGSEDGQVAEDENSRLVEADMRPDQEKIIAALARAEEEVAKSRELEAELAAARIRITDLEEQIGVLQHSLDQANAEVAVLRAHKSQPAANEQPSSSELSEGATKEQVEVLQQALARVQQDADALRAKAAISDSVAAIEAEEGHPSVAEQIAAQVDAIRAELTSRHDERVRQADETFMKRTELMKSSLNKRLAEVKTEIRDSLGEGHAQAIELLRVQHEEELASLRTRHQEELEELRRNDMSRFEQFKQEWRAEHPTLVNGDHSSMENGQQESLNKPWRPTDAEVKALINENEVAKAIVRNNITKKLNQEREALTAKVREEEQKARNDQLVEAEKKANLAREQAVSMEGKKYGVKLSMAENRARAAQAKIEYVQKAATDTPQKPIIEVWDVAKDVRPAPVTTPTLQPQSTALLPQTANPFAQVTLAAPTGATPSQSTFGKPTPTSQAQPAVGQPHAANAHVQARPTGPVNAAPIQSTFGKPTPIQASPSVPATPAGNVQPPNPSTTTSSAQGQSPQPPISQSASTEFSHQSAAQNGAPQPATMQQTPAQTSTQTPIQTPTQTPTPLATQAPLQQPSRLPDKPLQPQTNQRNPGTGPAALRGLHSGLPVPSSGRGGLAQSQHAQNQGNFNQQRGGGGNFGRGRGGTGRGGPGQIQSNNQPGGQSQGSPRGGFSGAAKQFVPTGTKRAREDGGLEGSQHAGDGKRMRGGAQGS